MLSIKRSLCRGLWSFARGLSLGRPWARGRRFKANIWRIGGSMLRLSSKSGKCINITNKRP